MIRMMCNFSDGCLFDSPASPEMDALVSGSPLKIIPRSPMREPPGDDDEEEDMDEDLLYLRLIALRSLAEEHKTEEGEVGESGTTTLAKEMKELLEEAEDAAKENSEKVETGEQICLSRHTIKIHSALLAVISEVITIDDEDDDDPISEMKLNLHETYLKCQVSSAVALPGLPYSPTQSQYTWRPVPLIPRSPWWT